MLYVVCCCSMLRLFYCYCCSMLYLVSWFSILQLDFWCPCSRGFTGVPLYHALVSYLVILACFLAFHFLFSMLQLVCCCSMLQLVCCCSMLQLVCCCSMLQLLCWHSMLQLVLLVFHAPVGWFHIGYRFRLPDRRNHFAEVRHKNRKQPRNGHLTTMD
jgi:hypothetical protein